jgi:CBS domain-containing protein
MIKITDYMTQPVITAKPSDTVKAVIDKMNHYNIGSLVVVEKNKLAGIITERDVLRKAFANKLDLEKTPIKKIMTTGVHTIKLSGSLIEVASMMKSHSMRRIVVIDNKGKPIGMVTSKDLIDILCT